MIEFTGWLLIYNHLWAQLVVVLFSCTPLVAADEYESDTSYFLIIIILMFTLLLAFTAVFTYKVLQKKARKETIKAFLQMTVENPGVVVVNRHLLISANNHIWKYLCCQGLNCDYQLFLFPKSTKKVVCCGKIPTFLLTQRVYIIIWVTITMEAIVCDTGTGQHNVMRIFNEEYIIPDSPNKNWLNTPYWPPTITLLLDTHYLVCLFFFLSNKIFCVTKNLWHVMTNSFIAVGIFLEYSCFYLVFYDIPVLICVNDVNPQEETIH